MITYQTHEADGVDLIVSPVTFDAASGVTTLIGATVSAWAQNKATGAKTAGAASVTSATSVRATFTGLVAGAYNVQVYATPVAHAIQTISDTDWAVKVNAGP